jgi:hypothetical protein
MQARNPCEAFCLQVVDRFLSQNFERVFDLDELGKMPYDFLEEFVQVVKRRST